MKEHKGHPILEAVLIAALSSLFTGLIEIVLDEIKERRKPKKGKNGRKD